MNSFQQTVAKLMKNNVFAEKDTKILVVTDHSTEALGKKFNEALEQDGWNTNLQIMSDRSKSGEEPSESISEAMLSYDLVFCDQAFPYSYGCKKKCKCPWGKCDYDARNYGRYDSSRSNECRLQARRKRNKRNDR